MTAQDPERENRSYANESSKTTRRADERTSDGVDGEGGC